MPKYLDYSNETQTNIIQQDGFEDLTRTVFDVIATNLAFSLGPLGSSATILDGMASEATKDGYTILSNYRFRNRYKRMIYTLILGLCRKMNNTVGDGTTTAICLTNEMLKSYLSSSDDLKRVYRLPRELTSAWDNVTKSLKDYVAEHSTPITTNEQIYNLAYIASNGNAKIASDIANIYKDNPTPSIKQKDSPIAESYVEEINGYDMPTNLITDLYAKNDDLSVDTDHMLVMVMTHKLDVDAFEKVIIPMMSVLRAMHEQLIIVAPAYDKGLEEVTTDQYFNREIMQFGKNSLIMTKYSSSTIGEHQVSDFSTIIGAKPITRAFMDAIKDAVARDGIDQVVDDALSDSSSEVYGLLGSIDKSHISRVNGATFTVNDIEDKDFYKNLVARAQKALEEAQAGSSYETRKMSRKVFDAQTRCHQLNMKTYVWYIGAESQLQKKITWDSVEDTIKCVASASKYGVVPGCQLTLMRGCIELREAIRDKYTPDENGNAYFTTADMLEHDLYNIINTALQVLYLKVLNGPHRSGLIRIIDTSKYTEETTDEDIINDISTLQDEIIRNSITSNQVFDIEKVEFNPNIITSAELDMMVITVATDLIKILTSGNQAICLSEIDDAHEDESRIALS
ncbi:MAG: hypothetical protein HDQ88_04295 [Clostridia bacterium]|nr:hypothetical protein [Clostridia bacterium]